MNQDQQNCRVVIESMPNAFAYHEIVLDDHGKPVDFIFLDVNPAYEQMTGLAKHAILGQRITEVVPDLKDQEFDWIKVCGKVALTGETIGFEQYSATLKRWYNVNVFSDKAGFFSVLFHDITEHKEMEASLRSSEESLRTTLHSIGDGVVATDATGRVTRMNPVAEQLTGWTLDAALNQPLAEVFRIVHAQTRQPLSNPVDTVLATGDVVTLANHTVLINKDGMEYQIADSAAPIHDDEERLTGVVLVFRDVSEEYRRREELRQQRVRLDYILKATKTGFDIIDADYRLHYVDPSWQQLYGDFVGRSCYEYFMGLAQPCEDCSVKQALATKEIVISERVMARENRIVEIHTIPLQDESGRWVVAEFKIDITERKRAEEEGRKFKTISDSAVHGNAIAGLDGTIQYVNEYFAHIHGYTAEELVGQPLTVFHSEAQQERVRQVTADLMQNGKFEPMEIWHMHRDGTEFPMLMSGVVIPDDHGHPQFIAATAVDISQQKQAEHERIGRQTAEAANRAKSMFIANMSHEIRTPLNAIVGFTQLLQQEESLTKKQTTQLQTIERCGEILMNLINDILDFSQIEANQAQLRLSEFDLQRLLRDLELVFRPKAEAKGLQLILEGVEGVPRFVKADESKVRQILMNVLGNGVKFTDEGGVTVRTCIGEADDPVKMLLIVEIEDTGPGIQREDVERIFDVFEQTTSGAKQGGTGLGLAITKGFVEMMKGEVTVDSEVGTGSLFRLTLPLQKAEKPSEATVIESRRVIGLAPNVGLVRVLVVDDQKDNRDLLQNLLEPVGIEVITACNGQEAIAAVKQWEPQAVLMDMRMPIMDGYEATKQIKNMPEAAHTPVIAVTASAFLDDMDQVLATGADGYVRKPFKVGEVFAVLAEHLDIGYVYAGNNEPPQNQGKAVSNHDLVCLPQTLRDQLLDAVESGDMLRLTELISEVEAVNRAVAQGLSALANEYDYDGLLRLLADEEADYGKPS